MRRYLLYFSYDGTDFHGWQIQPNAPTVQEELERCLAIVFQETCTLMAAGRTDTGVHAKEMVAHFDLDKSFDKFNVIHRLNSLLPKSISVNDFKEVKADFHARFDAVRRTYFYRIIKESDPFLSDYSYLCKYPLNIEKMNEAAKLLLGKHDFTSFSKTDTQTFTNDCEVFQAEWEQQGDQYLFTICANRFLRNMVRAVVGTLIEVGQEKIPPHQVLKIMQAKDRTKAGSSVPAQGLFLSSIEYPAAGFI